MKRREKLCLNCFIFNIRFIVKDNKEDLRVFTFSDITVIKLNILTSKTCIDVFNICQTTFKTQQSFRLLSYFNDHIYKIITLLTNVPEVFLYKIKYNPVPTAIPFAFLPSQTAE